MDTQARKLELIRWLIQLKDEHLLLKVEALQAEDVDFWNELSEQQKQEIRKGIAELDEGKHVDYERVISKHR
jgi:predicted transcriptional regulator